MDLIKKITIAIVGLLACSCASQQIKYPPDMKLEPRRELILETSALDIILATIKPGGFSWAYSTITGEKHMIADSLHPLHDVYFKDMPKIEKIDKVKMTFSYPPDYYVVRYWPEEYIGDDPIENDQYAKTIDVDEGIIILPNEEQGLVIEVKAVWESVNDIKETQGDAYYVFFVEKG